MKTLRDLVIETGNIISSTRHIAEHLGSWYGIGYQDVINGATGLPKDGWTVIGGNEGLRTVWFERTSDNLQVFFHMRT